MGKSILVLTGSARHGGNSALMAEAFVAGAQQAGHTVTQWNAGTKHLTGCIDCKTCFSRGKACNFDADFNELAPLLEAAEVIVFATPLYWYSFPAQLKAAIDKIYAFHVSKKALKIKESVLMVCGEDSEKENYTAIVETYKLIGGYEGWKDRGVIIAPGVVAKGDILKTKTLDKARRLGESL